MTYNFIINLKNKTFEVDGHGIRLHKSLYGAGISNQDSDGERIITLTYGKKVHEDEMDRIYSYLRFTLIDNS